MCRVARTNAHDTNYEVASLLAKESARHKLGDEHLQAEQESCYQVLDTELGPDEARQMHEAMERATAELRGLCE